MGQDIIVMIYQMICQTLKYIILLTEHIFHYRFNFLWVCCLKHVSHEMDKLALISIRETRLFMVFNCRYPYTIKLRFILLQYLLHLVYRNSGSINGTNLCDSLFVFI